MIFTSLRNQNRITAIILSHFILDLRSIHHSPGATTSLGIAGPNTNHNTSPGHNQNVSLSVRFATYIEGNAGASLDDSWARGRSQTQESWNEWEEEEGKDIDGPSSESLSSTGNRGENEANDNAEKSESTRLGGSTDVEIRYSTSPLAVGLFTSSKESDSSV